MQHVCVCGLLLGAVPALHRPGGGGRGERGGGRLPHGRAAAPRGPRGLPDAHLAPRGLHRHGDGLLRFHAAVQEMHHRVSGDELSDHITPLTESRAHDAGLYSLTSRDLAKNDKQRRKMQWFSSAVCEEILEETLPSAGHRCHVHRRSARPLSPVLAAANCDGIRKDGFGYFETFLSFLDPIDIFISD